MADILHGVGTDASLVWTRWLLFHALVDKMTGSLFPQRDESCMRRAALPWKRNITQIKERTTNRKRGDQLVVHDCRFGASRGFG